MALVSPPIKLLNVRDFSGGLNLVTDQFHVAPNEVPDCLNVDFNDRGGWTLRKGMKPFGTGLPGTVTQAYGFGAFETSAGTKQLLATLHTSAPAYTVYRNTAIGSAWTSTLVRTVTNINRFATFKDNLYIVNGVDACGRWTGSSNTALGVTTNSDRLIPNGGDMPLCRLITVMAQRVFIAYTNESAVSYPNRLRFSFPNFPEDWHPNDYIDIDTGNDGDVITALVPVSERLLIFKQKSVHVLSGYDQDTFRIVKLTDKVGTPSQDSVISTESGVFFWDATSGVHVISKFDGPPTWLFAKLRRALTDGTINISAGQAAPVLGWKDRKLYVNVPISPSAVNTRCYVFDTALGKNGAWTQHNYAFSTMIYWRPTAGTPYFLGGGAGVEGKTAGQTHALEQQDGKDIFVTIDTAIASTVLTRWFDADQPAIKKRWRRVRFILPDQYDTQLTVQLFKNYDPSVAKKTFIIQTTVPAAYLIWADAAGAGGTGNWGEANWAGVSAARESLKKGRSGGVGYAIQYRITGPNTFTTWGVDQLSVPYIQQPPR